MLHNLKLKCCILVSVYVVGFSKDVAFSVYFQMWAEPVGFAASSFCPHVTHTADTDGRILKNVYRKP
jgi:hypothetical protein